MKKHIALLRGINVGGRRKILMADLKEMFSKLGHSEVISYIQSGNIIFSSKSRKSNTSFEKEITIAIKERFGHDVPVIIRSVKEINDLIKLNPFLKDSQIEDLHVTFLKEVPDAEKINKLQELDFTPDQFSITDHHAYIACYGGYRNTKLTNTLFEKKLKVSATTRNWKTILKLQALSQ